MRLGATSTVEVGQARVRENAGEMVRGERPSNAVPPQVLGLRKTRPQEEEACQRPGNRAEFRDDVCRPWAGWRDDADALGSEPIVAPTGQRERAAKEKAHTLFIKKRAR